MEVAMHHNGYTGHLFEEEVVGRCRVIHRGYMRWRDAAKLARESQPARKTPTAARLEREVSQQFGKAVQFFTAVGTPLDFFHGVDGFFEFEGFVVTIDLTMNPHKETGKAHMVIQQGDLDDISRLAGFIAREMQTQMRRA